MILFQQIPHLPVVGELAPDVMFRRADGSSLPLKSLRGRVVVIEFTALNCPPCRELAPKLEEFAAKHPEAVFLTIATDPPANLPRLTALRGKDARTELVQDSYDPDRSKMAVWKFGNVAVPTMFVIGPDGRMASRLIQQGVDGLSHVAERIAWAMKKRTAP